MKHKLKKIIPSAFFLIAFIIFSCSEDYEIHDHNHNHSKIKVKPISINDVISNQKAFEKLTNPKSRFKTNSSFNRIINDTVNNFSIETENGIFIEDGDYHSYTFKITRPNGSNFLLENVVVSRKNETEYETILYQYNINQQELNMIDNGEFVDLKGKINKIFLENSIIASEITAKYYYNGSCYEDNPVYIPGNTCQEGIHDLSYVLSHIGAWDQCTYYNAGTYTATAGYWTWQSSLVSCDDNGGGDISSGSGEYLGGGWVSGSTTTTPVNNCRTCIPVYAPTPCDKVKDQFTNNPTLQDKLNTLSGLTSSSTERGFQKLSNSSIIQSAAVGTNGAVKMPEIPNGVTCTMFAHTHNAPAVNTYSIFSWDDLVGIAKLIRQGKIDTNNFVTFLATADGTYYALTIENPTAFSQFFATIQDPNYNQAMGLKMASEMNKYYDPGKKGNAIIQENSSDNIKDEKAFLDFLNDNNLGASLFESNSTFSTFEEVKHNKITNSIDKQPCL